ncbi:polysaccharide lyase [Glaciecola siphonariae]|uniref:Polysaccharide lyase n=1 Tax=Glaciecola siphonariae TaxID=521012 RepID=A0ABV9LQ45_9ALTE
MNIKHYTVFINSMVMLLLSSLASAMSADAKTVFEESFDDIPVGAFTESEAASRWPSIKWAQLRGRFSIVENQKQGHTLRAKYPAGGVGPSESGGQFPLYFEPADEYTLSYKLYFEEGFEFVLGGKLPGLASGGEKYSGGIHAKTGDGWTARFMYREQGQAEVYLYYVDNPEQWGHSVLLGDLKFETGKWYTIVQRIKLNKPGQADALLQVWVNDEMLLDKQNFRLRLGEKGQIDSFYFSTFFGGNQPHWAPKKDVYIQFDDITIVRP